MDYLGGGGVGGGAKGMLPPPLSNYWVGGLAPPLPTPMVTHVFLPHILVTR